MNGLLRKFRPIALIFLAISCVRGTPEPSLWNGITPIGEILRNPKAWEGKSVKILAYYRWFDVFGEAGSGPPVTRSDVAFADITGAIYATHWENPGLSPKDTDRLLLLEAEVKVNPNGLPYLEVRRTQEVEGLPKGVVLRAQLMGGVAGLVREVLLAEDGTALFLDRKLNQHARAKVEAKAVTEALRQIRPLLGQELGKPVPDGFTYTIYAWEGDKIRTLILHAETAPENVKPLREFLNELFFQTFQQGG